MNTPESTLPENLPEGTPSGMSDGVPDDLSARPAAASAQAGEGSAALPPALPVGAHGVAPTLNAARDAAAFVAQVFADSASDKAPAADALPGAPVALQDAAGQPLLPTGEAAAASLQGLLQGQNILILGLGASGLAMARWCVRTGAARVTVADTRSAPPQLAALQRELPQVQFVAGPFGAALVEGQDLHAVYRSPGLSPAEVAPVFVAACAHSVRVGGELSLYSMALQALRDGCGYAPAVLAITGTNGKTTVASLTGQLIAHAGKTVAVAGNIGPTLLDTLSAHLDTGSLPEVWVLELSSFQLDGVEGFEPTAAVVLNITQDHLDWHGSALSAAGPSQGASAPSGGSETHAVVSVGAAMVAAGPPQGASAPSGGSETHAVVSVGAAMAAYAQAKSRIFGAHGLMVLNRDDAAVMAMLPAPQRARLQKAQVRAHTTFGCDMPQRPGDFGMEEVNGMVWLVRALEADETRKKRNEAADELHIQRLMPADVLRIRGRHNASNALAALALCAGAGCALGPLLFGLREYRGEPHRVEPIGIVNEVEFFDDSKGTNVGATVAALQGLGADRKLVLILGGEGKGQDFAPLAAPVARYVRAVVLIGRDAPLIRDALAQTGVPLVDAESMPAAVAQANQRAHAGDAVLMSPACASFDMFDNYEHRARVFGAAVADLARDAGVMLEVQA